MNELKLFTARVEFDYVVVAQDEDQAFRVALDEMSEAFNDLDRREVDIVITAGVNAYNWDDECIPYGGDGSTRTSEYNK